MINLMQGDCLDRMKEIESGSVDMILTDPPYGTTACKWDSVIDFDLMWEQLKRIIKPNGAIVMTASQPFTSALIMSNPKQFRHNLVWDKVSPTGHLNAKKKPLLRHEDVVLFSPVRHGNFTYNPEMRKGKYRNKSPVRSTDNVKDRCYGTVKHKADNFNDDYYPTSIHQHSTGNRLNKVHPTQKPVALMEYLIKTYTNEAETVLDFTMGSGSTGVACKNLNRKFIGIELDETYFNIAKNRIENS
ncbi:MAG: putative modification methylase [Prokaryotic dsDNA virus sp.]|nr:MAG: putative modification methylase [Prokaryotic dsDNA virus sp.]|tara:strand:- start:2533 stop:3264 length:732 start_codon:yes stop_codon:yes gene_type:complete